MRRVALCAVLLALLSPAIASAELSDAERGDIKDLIESAKSLRAGERYLADAIAGGSTAEARPALARALARFQAAQIDHWQALAHLLHIGTENPTPKPEFSPLEWYASAWFYLNRYESQLVQIQADLSAAKTFNTQNSRYQDSVRRARDIWVGSARSYVDRIDPSLEYSDPWPQLLPGKTVHTVVGPHGDYRSMQWLINRGKNYAMDTYGALITAYGQGADGQKLRDAWVQSSEMLDALDRASGLLADVTFSAEEANEDRFCRALRVTKTLTVIAAQRYQAWGDAVSDLVPSPYNLVVAKLVDSWKHSVDLSSWKAFVFPESTRCPNFLRD